MGGSSFGIKILFDKPIARRLRGRGAQPTSQTLQPPNPRRPPFQEAARYPYKSALQRYYYGKTNNAHSNAEGKGR